MQGMYPTLIVILCAAEQSLNERSFEEHLQNSSLIANIPSASREAQAGIPGTLDARSPTATDATSDSNSVILACQTSENTDLKTDASQETAGSCSNSTRAGDLKLTTGHVDDSVARGARRV